MLCVLAHVLVCGREGGEVPCERLAVELRARAVGVLRRGTVVGVVEEGVDDLGQAALEGLLQCVRVRASVRVRVSGEGEG